MTSRERKGRFMLSFPFWHLEREGRFMLSFPFLLQMQGRKKKSLKHKTDQRLYYLKVIKKYGDLKLDAFNVYKLLQRFDQRHWWLLIHSFVLVSYFIFLRKLDRVVSNSDRPHGNIAWKNIFFKKKTLSRTDYIYAKISSNPQLPIL